MPVGSVRRGSVRRALRPGRAFCFFRPMPRRPGARTLSRTNQGREVARTLRRFTLPDRPAARPTSSAVESLECRRLFAATYYVSLTGNDANPGTDPALPWRHIQKAMDSATPGSTVNVLPGKYNERLVVNVSGN